MWAKNILKFFKICWTAIIAAAREFKSLSIKEKNDSNQAMINNDIKISIPPNKNDNIIEIKLNNSQNKSEVAKLQEESGFDFSFEEASFVSNMIRTFFEYLIRENKLEKFTQDFVIKFNKKCDDLYYLNQTPSDIDTFSNLEFNKFIKREILDISGIFEKDKLEKFYNIYLNCDLLLDFSRTLNKLGFVAYRT